MALEELYMEQSGSIATIVLNRAEKLNAFTHDMEAELYELLREIRRRPDINVVVIKGKGRSFSAGHDLNLVYDDTEEKYAIDNFVGYERRRGFKQLDIWFELLWDLPQALIAQVQGHCFNFALELAMNCDFVVAADDAKFVHRPVGGAARSFNLWPYLVGPRQAKLWGMLGEMVPGTEAARHGMINKSVPLEQLDDEVADMAERLSHVPLEFIALEKQGVNACMQALNLRVALGYTMELHALSHLTDASQRLAGRLKADGWKSTWAERDAARYNTADSTS